MSKGIADTPILTGKVCPYCDDKTEYKDSSIVYGTSYGMIYICRRCDAYVGVHKGTNKALGRLANRELREAKKKAHHYFDKLWQLKMKEGFNKGHARAKGYKWLSQQMDLHPDLTHIAMMDVAQCNRVVEICRPYTVR